jgi:formylglycine-generating enzyme required for sulfatase activity
MKHFIFIFILSLMVIDFTQANNIVVSDVYISSQNNTLKAKWINFNITWDNSWYVNSGPNNWDAAWVFVKYRRKTDNTWHHATLNYVDGTGSGDGHTEPFNSNISSSNDTGNGGAHGVFIHRTDLGQGSVSYIGVSLRWNYGVDGLANGDNVELCVMGIEMVYVPQSSFYVGTGSLDPLELGAFTTYHDPYIFGHPYFISSEAAIPVGTFDGYLHYSVPPSLPAGSCGDRQGPIPASFPKGYNAFYCMKYEITQAQYVAFLNKLSILEQTFRTVDIVSIAGSSVMTTGYTFRNSIEIVSPVSGYTSAVLGCNLDDDGNFDEANDGQSIACNLLQWADIAAYLDWAALRPMTELEYEKACRGNIRPVPLEFAWGTSTVTGATSISNSGSNNESAQPSANCIYDYLADLQGPVRAGCFAKGTTTRSQSGASYYGVMDLSGNVAELTITVGNSEGRSFNGILGDGVINEEGQANQTNWPNKITALGSGSRGGNWTDTVDNLRLSNRSSAIQSVNFRGFGSGGRGVRKAPQL